MIRRQTVIALGIALVLGLVAVYLANLYLGRTEQRAAAEPTTMTRIAVAAIPLEYGADITADKVKFVAFPAQSIPPGAYRSLAEMMPQGKRRVAIRPMAVNEPLLSSKLSGEGQGASIAALLPDGQRAAAVRINDVSGVAGFVQPSDAVDVLITRASGGGDGQITDVLLQNVRVIAIDQNVKDSNGQPVIARTATLEVNAVEAQKLALGQQLGQLSLVLRKPGVQDNSAVVQTVSLNDLRYTMYGGQYQSPSATTRVQTGARVAITQPRRIVRRPATPVVVRPSTRSVEVVRGTQNSNYEVGGYGS